VQPKVLLSVKTCIDFNLNFFSHDTWLKCTWYHGENKESKHFEKQNAYITWNQHFFSG
jgi:hypothetical protein